MKADISTLHKPDILILRRHVIGQACLYGIFTYMLNREAQTNAADRLQT